MGSAARAALGATWLLGPPAWAMSAAGRVGARGMLHRLERSWARVASGLLDIRLEVGGLDNLSSGGPFVVAPLHESFVDSVALLQLPLDLRFVVREELVAWKVLGRHLRSTQQVMIRPESPRVAWKSLLGTAPAVVASGESLVVFPQGSILGIEAAFQSGAFRLADRLEVPLLPVVITGTHRVWEHPYSPRLRFGQRVSVRGMEPLPVGRAAALARDLEVRMKEIALGGRVAPPRRFDPERDGYWDGYAYGIDPAFGELRRQVDEHRGRLVTA